MFEKRKTPARLYELAALICYAELLQSSWATMPREEMQQCVRAIAWNGHKMNEVVDAILLLHGLGQEKVAMTATGTGWGCLSCGGSWREWADALG